MERSETKQAECEGVRGGGFVSDGLEFVCGNDEDGDGGDGWDRRRLLFCEHLW